MLEEMLEITQFPPEVQAAYLRDMVRDPKKSHGGEAGGLSLVLECSDTDAYGKGTRRVAHIFPVPAATFNREAWMRWLFDRVADMRLHELMEYFTVGDEHPFAPLHGPGDNPYVVHVASSDLQRRTAYTGEVKDGPA